MSYNFSYHLSEIPPAPAPGVGYHGVDSGISSPMGIALGVGDSIAQFKGSIGPVIGIWNSAKFSMCDNT